jgi:hypothetical protein
MKEMITPIIKLLIRSAIPTMIVLGAASGIYAQQTRLVAKGDWANTGIVMTVTDSGASIRFDCADATIAKQLRIKKDGSFVAEGTFMRSGPGPIREDAQGTAVAFKGKVAGKTMSLQMADAKTGEKLGDYTVTQGQSGRLHRCY